MSTSNSQEFTITTGRETVVLRARTLDSGGLIERESVLRRGRESEIRFTQVLLANKINVQEFRKAEPHQQIKDAIPKIAQQPLAATLDDIPLDRDRDVLDMIRRLARAPDEAALLRQMTAIVHELGAHMSFFCLTEKGSDGSHQSYRVIAGSNADLIQKYAEERWYATDPFMTHAAHSQQPFFSSDVGLIENLEGSRREMAEVGRRFGASSWITVPAHGPEARFFGVLYVAMPGLPKDGGEEPLRKNRLLFKLIAGEIFDWYERQEIASSLNCSGLIRLELDILDASARGETSEMIAESLGLTANAVTRKHFKSINAKLHTHSITESVRVARARGLLAIASSRKVGYVLHSRVYGVYLCSDHGIPFWSGLLPSGIDEAKIFSDIEAAEDALSRLHLVRGHDVEFKRVDVHHTAQTATIGDCVRAGLPAWDPSVVTTGGRPDDSGTAGDIDVPPPSCLH